MDPISDFFIQIKNAQKAGHAEVRVPYSRFKNEIALALQREGLVGEVQKRGKRVKKILEIQLIKKENEPVIHGVRLLSRPSKREYVSYRAARAARAGGIVFLSTPRGIMSGRRARKEKVGGQLIAEVY